MMQKTINILSLLGAVFLNAVTDSTWAAENDPSVDPGKPMPIEVRQIAPSEGDQQKNEHKRKTHGSRVGEGEEVYVVKLHVTMPPPGSEAYFLYIGEKKLEEYGSFEGGVFFKVYHRKDLEAFRGAPVRFQVRGRFIELGVAFPLDLRPEAVNPAGIVALPRLEDVLRREGN